jgi:hypothetical protein
MLPSPSWPSECELDFCIFYHSLAWTNSFILHQTSKLKAPIQTLMNTLVLASKAADFCQAIILSDSISFSVDFFYQWLVANNVSLEVLEKIAVAAQNEEVQQLIGVSAVQMFRSRALEQKSPCKAARDNGDDNDDEI